MKLTSASALRQPDGSWTFNLHDGPDIAASGRLACVHVPGVSCGEHPNGGPPKAHDDLSDDEAVLSLRARVVAAGGNWAPGSVTTSLGRVGWTKPTWLP